MRATEPEMERDEQSLLRLGAEFTQYRLQIERAHECMQALLARRGRGFPNSETAALYEETLACVVQDYLRLCKMMVVWIGQAYQVVTVLPEF